MPDTEETALQMSSEFQAMVDEYFEVQIRYQAAMRQVETRLNNLDDEFRLHNRRSPIHSIHTRMKTVRSMMNKLQRKQMPVSMLSATENLYDIAGVRVICSYISDIYTVSHVLCGQEDIELVRINDYIKHPKENGYRSLHLILRIPVFLAEGRILVPVEVQIRTIAMDFWATLEHSLRYKTDIQIPAGISNELKQTAQDIAVLDARMQSIHDHLGEIAEDSRLM